jgi:hypothetical protein
MGSSFKALDIRLHPLPSAGIALPPGSRCLSLRGRGSRICRQSRRCCGSWLSQDLWVLHISICIAPETVSTFDPQIKFVKHEIFRSFSSVLLSFFFPSTLCASCVLGEHTVSLTHTHTLTPTCMYTYTCIMARYSFLHVSASPFLRSLATSSSSKTVRRKRIS